MNNKQKSALLIVDVQQSVMKDAWNSENIINNISKIIEWARANKNLVIWIQHSDENLKIDTPDWEFAKPLRPTDEEVVLQKHFPSAFEETELANILSQQGIRNTIVVGAATNWCVRATLYAAIERRINLTLVADAHTTKSLKLSDDIVLDAQTLVYDLNTTMKWLAYPEVELNVKNTSELL